MAVPETGLGTHGKSRPGNRRLRGGMFFPSALILLFIAAHTLPAQAPNRAAGAHGRYLASGDAREIERFVTGERDGTLLRDFVARLKAQPGTNLDLGYLLRLLAGRNEDEWAFDLFFAEGPGAGYGKTHRLVYLTALTDMGRTRALAEGVEAVFRDAATGEKSGVTMDLLRPLLVLGNSKDGEALGDRLAPMARGTGDFANEVAAARVFLARGGKDGRRLGERCADLAARGRLPEGAARTQGLFGAILGDVDAIAVDLLTFGRDREAVAWVGAFGAMGLSPTTAQSMERCRSRLGLSVPSRLRTLFLAGEFSTLLEELPESQDPLWRMACLAAGKSPSKPAASAVDRNFESFAAFLIRHDLSGARTLLFSNQMSLQDERLMALRGVLAGNGTDKDFAFMARMLKLAWTWDVRAEALWKGEGASVAPAVSDWALLRVVEIACHREDGALLDRMALQVEKVRGAAAKEEFQFRIGRYWAVREPGRGQTILRKLLRDFPDTVYRASAQNLL